MSEIIIGDHNWRQFVQDPVVDGEQKKRGLVPRDYGRHPVGMYGAGQLLDVPLVPRLEWSERIRDMGATKSRLSDIRNAGMNGGPIPSRDQDGRGYCLPPGTLVKMADGTHKAIEHVRLLDEVLTAEGNISRVAQCHVRDYQGPMCLVKSWGHGHLKLTPNHSVLTQRGYVRADALTESDWICVPRYSPVQENIVMTADHVKGLKRRLARVEGRESWETRMPSEGDEGHVEIPESIKMSANAGWIFGLWLAEGHIDGRRVVWSFNANEEETLAKPLVEALEKEWGAAAKIVPGPASPNVVQVRLQGTLWCQLFSSICGQKAKHKKPHADLMKGGAQFLEAMFDGWMAGDGCLRGRDRTYRCGASISHALALSMYDIANFLGLNPSISVERGVPSGSVKSRQTAYKVQVNNDPKMYCRNYRFRTDQLCCWRKVRRVDVESYSGKVFNIGVEGDNSYVAEGVGVHNCWAHSSVSALLLLRARDNQPYADLSAYAIACIIKDYRDEGGWGAQSMDWIVANGCPVSEFWPQQGTSRKHDTPAMRENAKLHRVTEGWWDLADAQYDRNLSWDQVMTCLLNRIPVVVDYNWWGHSVCAADPVETSPGKFGVRIWNSWGDGWSENGMGVLEGSKAVPDGSVAPRVIQAAPK